MIDKKMYTCAIKNGKGLYDPGSIEKKPLCTQTRAERDCTQFGWNDQSGRLLGDLQL